MESAPTDLSAFDGDAVIARKSIEQSKRNQNELFRELGITSIVGGIAYIDPDKLEDLILRRKLLDGKE